MVKIAAGNTHSLAAKSDGTAWAWGNGIYGCTGTGTVPTAATTVSTPVQVTGISGVADVAAGASYSLALKSDGTVWAFGYNGNGRLGDGTTTNRGTPTQVTDQAVLVAAGDAHGLAVKNDGTVWGWGNNANGKLGFPTTTVNVLVPTKCHEGLFGDSGYIQEDEEDIENIITTLNIDEIAVPDTLVYNGTTSRNGKCWYAVKPQVSANYDISVLVEGSDADITVLDSELIAAVPVDGKYALKGNEIYYIKIQFSNSISAPSYTCEIGMHVDSVSDYWSFYKELTDESSEYWVAMNPEKDGSYNLFLDSGDNVATAVIMDHNLVQLTADGDGNYALLSNETYYIKIKGINAGLSVIPATLTLQRFGEFDDEPSIDTQLTPEEDGFEFDLPDEGTDEDLIPGEDDVEAPAGNYDDGTNDYNFSDDTDDSWLNNYNWEAGVTVGANDQTGSLPFEDNGIGSANGCGAVAVYNAMLILNDPKSLPDVIYDLDIAGGANAGGLLGENPDIILGYFLLHGYTVDRTFFPSSVDTAIKNSKVAIYLYAHSQGAHYITVQYENGKFKVYNDASGTVDVYDSFDIEHILANIQLYTPMELITIR